MPSRARGHDPLGLLLSHCSFKELSGLEEHVPLTPQCGGASFNDLSGLEEHGGAPVSRALVSDEPVSRAPVGGGPAAATRGCLPILVSIASLAGGSMIWWASLRAGPPTPASSVRLANDLSGLEEHGARHSPLSRHPDSALHRRRNHTPRSHLPRSHQPIPHQPTASLTAHRTASPKSKAEGGAKKDGTKKEKEKEPPPKPKNEAQLKAEALAAEVALRAAEAETHRLAETAHRPRAILLHVVDDAEAILWGGPFAEGGPPRALLEENPVARMWLSAHPSNASAQLALGQALLHVPLLHVPLLPYECYLCPYYMYLYYVYLTTCTLTACTLTTCTLTTI